MSRPASNTKQNGHVKSNSANESDKLVDPFINDVLQRLTTLQKIQVYHLFCFYFSCVKIIELIFFSSSSSADCGYISDNSYVNIRSTIQINFSSDWSNDTVAGRSLDNYVYVRRRKISSSRRMEKVNKNFIQILKLILKRRFSKVFIEIFQYIRIFILVLYLRV